jgi:hypothetical protein
VLRPLSHWRRGFSTAIGVNRSCSDEVAFCSALRPHASYWFMLPNPPDRRRMTGAEGFNRPVKRIFSVRPDVPMPVGPGCIASLLQYLHDGRTVVSSPAPCCPAVAQRRKKSQFGVQDRSFG